MYVRPDRLLAELPRAAPEPATAALLARGAAFLCGVGLPSVKPKIVAAGYTSRDHRAGLESFRLASGEISYEAWIDLEAKDPHREPGEPEMLGRLEGALKELSAAATKTAASFLSAPDRGRLLSALLDEGQPAPRTRFGRARRLFHSMDYLADFRLPGAEALGASIRMGQNAGTFRLAEVLVQELERILRAAPFDDARKEDIAATMREAQLALAKWLTEQTARVSPHLDDRARAALAIGSSAAVSSTRRSMEQLRAFLDEP